VVDKVSHRVRVDLRAINPLETSILRISQAVFLKFGELVDRCNFVFHLFLAVFVLHRVKDTLVKIEQSAVESKEMGIIRRRLGHLLIVIVNDSRDQS
jgi:hypothetical protein